ncbi:CHAD domain-containing protein [Cupriavidus lacunae]|uniref:CHAD domain-containing protein n=1 Tax=Cupriavidus lacunae TaxID=2666307 RepID=A0A370MVD1_9BURK|nr:CHAD domain-containing protein [Cupriavidus lacunae]RDJ97276.1 CHAD domain-containing protein [Cupriavidus lacunae]
MVSCLASSELHRGAHALTVLPHLLSSDVATLEHCSSDYLVSNDPEVGHELRVALRRLRALLWAYQALLPEGLANHWRQQLGDIANRIGAPRNWDVIIDTLLRAAVPSSHPSALIFLEALDGIRHNAREESRMVVSSPTHAQLLSAFMAAIDHVAGAQPEQSRSVGELARGRVKAASRRLDKLLTRAGDGSLAVLHQTRIQIKRLRYLLEYFSPVLKKADRKRIVGLAQLQGALGALNDVVVGSAYISALPALAEYAPAHELFMRWLKKEKKVRRRKAVRAVKELSRPR